MKQAFIEILKAIAERIKPKEYEYVLIKETEVYSTERDKLPSKIIYFYFCSKTGSSKIIKISNNN